MKVIRKLVIIGFSVGLFFFPFQSADAYVKEGWKMFSKSNTYKWGDRLNGSSIIKTGWTSGAAAWKTASGINFTYNYNSLNVLNSWNETSSTLYGRTNVIVNSNYVARFTAELNSGNTNITKSNVAKSTAVHEFGHVIGIGHTGGTSIMNSQRDRTKIHTPQADDKNGVNALY